MLLQPFQAPAFRASSLPRYPTVKYHILNPNVTDQNQCPIQKQLTFKWCCYVTTVFQVTGLAGPVLVYRAALKEPWVILAHSLVFKICVLFCKVRCNIA